MSYRTLALICGAIVLAIAADILANGGAVTLFLLRKFTDLVEELSFWR